MSNQEMANPLENNDYPLKSLFDGYTFQIPNYQRFYSWDHNHYEDLWNDLLNIVDEQNRNHYMGTVICKDEDKSIKSEEFTENYRLYSIVDGQQRFTTLILLIKAIMEEYKKIDDAKLLKNTKKRYEKLPIEKAEEKYIQDTSLLGENEGFEVQNKLKLQSDDNDIFKSILRNEVETVEINTPSEQRLKNAYKFFSKELNKKHKNLSHDDFVKLIGNLLKSINNLQFMVYTIESNEEATLIFESINDRGKALSNLDKTKSFLMHKIYLTGNDSGLKAVSLDEVQQRFGDIYSYLQTIENETRTKDLKEDRIQQYHYIAEIPREINKTYLKEETDRQRTLRAGAPVYLETLKWHFNQLYEDSQDQPHENYPRECDREIDHYTRGLKRYYSHTSEIATYNDDKDIAWELAKIFALGRIGNFYPLLLAIWDNYVDNEISNQSLHNILEKLEIAAFRIYAVANKRADTGQSKFYRIANKFAQNKMDLNEVELELEDAIDTYQDDFSESLRDPDLYSKMSNSDIRYLLYSYELHKRSEEKLGDAPSIEKVVQNAKNEYSIDHIWPQNTDKLNLTNQELNQHEKLKDSIGNLTLTPGPRNSSWKNLPFEDKKDRRNKNKEKDSNKRLDYYTSDFVITRKLATDHETWSEEKIKNRTEEIIEFAEKRWSLDPNLRNSVEQIILSEYSN